MKTEITDTERLDWIERTRKIVMPDIFNDPIWQVGDSGNFQPPIKRKSLREAIDAAIEREKE